jgi:hypothetical protein
LRIGGDATRPLANLHVTPPGRRGEIVSFADDGTF